MKSTQTWAGGRQSTTRLYRGLVLGLALAALALPARRASAQGVTTGAITGLVNDTEGKPVTGAQVQVINRSTGYATGTLTRPNGLYLVQGLEVGGPYSVIITSIGFQKAQRDGIRVVLSQATRVDVQLSTQAVELSALEVTAVRAADFSPTHQGVATVVTDTLLRRVPTLSRDFTDLTKLTPQVVRPQDGGGPSAGGTYNRFNAFTIDGANEGDRFALNASGGVPGSASNGKLISIEAVKEFKVFLTPSDVRQGNFTGMLVNAVTKNGTNQLHGGATYSFRNQDLAPDPISKTQNKVQQYSFSLGGPIIKNKLHFFVAPEFQARTTPATGPYVGQPTNATPLAVSTDSLAAIANIMKSQYGFDVGTTGPVNIDNPLTNLFGRIDYEISPQHRLVVREIYNRAENGSFSRNFNQFNSSPNVQNSGFRLGSNFFSSVDKNTSTVAQLYSNFANGRSNELIAGYNHIADVRSVPVQAPEISVGVTPPGGTSPTTPVTFGTEQFSPGNILRQDLYEAVDNLSLPFGAHTATVGVRFEQDHIFNNFAQRSYGVYVFPNITALAADKPSGYTIGYDNSGTGKGIPADFRVQQYSLYAQDQWAATDRLTLTYGVRADIPRFVDKPLENPQIAALFPGVHTSDVPKTQILWSPRIGFNFDPTRDQKNQIRGSVGIYTGPPPFILVGNAYANTGLGLVTLTCTGAATPAFTVDITKLPHACAGQAAPAPGAAGTAGVNHTDPNFRYPQSFTASLGLDRQLPFAAVLTLEGVYRHAINGVLIRDLNIKGPRLVGGVPYTDRNGRVLYADTMTNGTSGGNPTVFVANDSQRVVTRLNGVSFSEGLIDVTNQSKDYNYSLSAQLRKRFSDALDATVAYTYMHSVDVQSLTSDRAISNWRNGRTVSGSHADLTPTISYFNRPHRLVAFGTYTLPWKITDVSAYLEYQSGTPITYTVVGDLNGDGYNGNDPIYVPKDATDPNEFKIGSYSNGVFTQDAAAAKAFNDFISGQKCLNEQRGQIMARNSCTSPWQKRLDLSLRQSIPQIKSQDVTLQLDVFNFLNLLNRKWGQNALPTLSGSFPQQSVLTQVARTAGPLNQSMSVFTFSQTARTKGPFDVSQTSPSNFYQIQLTLRYAF